MMAEKPIEIIFNRYANDNREVFIELFPKLVTEHEGKWVLISDGRMIQIFENMHSAMKYAREVYSTLNKMVAPLIQSNNNLMISIPV